MEKQTEITITVYTSSRLSDEQVQQLIDEVREPLHARGELTEDDLSIEYFTVRDSTRD